MFIRKNVRIYFIAAVLTLFISTPLFFASVANAAGIVNCGGDGQEVCTICHLVEGIHGIVQYIIGLMVIVAITVITVAGIMYIVSAGGGMVELAKKAILNTLIGITIVLVAFISITYILNNMFGANTADKPVGAGGLTLDAGWNFSCDKTPSLTSKGGGDGTTGDGDTPPPSGPPKPLGSISTRCNAYDDSFNKAANNDKDAACLLKAIAMQESSCNATVGSSGAGAVGFMQIKPENAGGADLNNAEQSIQRAAQLLKENQTQLNKYTEFDVSKGTALGSEKEQLPDGSMYYSGNDDLIASYNGGGGTKASAGKIGTFGLSEACPCGSKCSPNIPDGYPAKMPAWQCQYYKDGTIEGEGVNANNPQKQGYKETRDYVKNVQFYQKSCLENK